MNSRKAAAAAWLVGALLFAEVSPATAAPGEDPDEVSWETDLPAAGGTVRIGGQIERASSGVKVQARRQPRIVVEVSFLPRCKVGGRAILAATASCEPVPCPASQSRDGQWMYRMTQSVDTVTGKPGPLRRGSELCIPKPGAPQPSLESLVLRELRSLALPALEVRSTPESRTFVHLPTTFSVQPPERDRDLGTILGHHVTVTIRPVSYRWTFGDGTVRTTSADGHQRPAASVRHSFDAPATVAVAVRTTYRAKYRVDGGTPHDVPGTVSVDGPATALPVHEARTQLVAPPT